MPLHLLSQKSWNVYAPDNIARVKRDQAQAKANDEEADRRLQQQDAEERLAILRGEEASATVRVEEQSAEQQPSRGNAKREQEARDEKKRRRRLRGEDDTDRDLRLAREDIEARYSRGDHGRGKEDKKRKRIDAPITDRNGHINLFPNDERAVTGDSRVDKADTMEERKRQELEDQCTMRFSNAAGHDGLKQGPWYANRDARARALQQQNMDVIEGKDVWGRSDPSANDREKIRQTKNDPLAFMMSAQTQFKQVEREKEMWQEEQRRKLEDLERDYKRKRRMERMDKRQRRSKHDKDEHREHRGSRTTSHDRRQSTDEIGTGGTSKPRGFRYDDDDSNLEHFRLDA